MGMRLFFKICQILNFFRQTKISISMLCGKSFLNMEINNVDLEQKQQRQQKVNIQYWIMVRHVKREYIIDLVNQSYINQKRTCNFCFKLNCMFCKRSTALEKQLRNRGFNTSKNAKQKKWFVIYENYRINLFPVSK